MDNHFHLLTASKRHNGIVASKSTRLRKIGHCKEKKHRVVTATTALLNFQHMTLKVCLLKWLKLSYCIYYYFHIFTLKKKVNWEIVYLFCDTPSLPQATYIHLSLRSNNHQRSLQSFWSKLHPTELSCLSVQLYCQKYSLTYWNHGIQLFQSLPWPQGIIFKHEDMQTAFTKICERMGCSQVLSKFQCGTVIGPV